MAGHSKWHQIRHKKAANDNKKGKVLTKHAKLLSVVGRSDPNPENNAALRNAIANAKADSVPNDNINRILKKLSGQGKDAIIYSEYVYEGFGPEGIPILATALTENNNRTFHEVRTAFEKNGGRLGVSGAVMFQYDHLGVFILENNQKTEEDMMELCMEIDAKDFSYDRDETEIICDFSNIGSIRDKLQEQDIEIKKSEIQYRCKDPQILSDSELLQKIEDFIDKIDEVDDVSDVFPGYLPA